MDQNLTMEEINIPPYSPLMGNGPQQQVGVVFRGKYGLLDQTCMLLKPVPLEDAIDVSRSDCLSIVTKCEKPLKRSLIALLFQIEEIIEIKSAITYWYMPFPKNNRIYSYIQLVSIRVLSYLIEKIAYSSCIIHFWHNTFHDRESVNRELSQTAIIHIFVPRQ